MRDRHRDSPGEARAAGRRLAGRLTVSVAGGGSTAGTTAWAARVGCHLQRARSAAATAGLGPQVTVRTIDAGLSDACATTVPADRVLLVGVSGDITDDDLRTTISASAQSCAPGAMLIWSRGRGTCTGGDRNSAVRALFAEGGFSEIGYKTRDVDGMPAPGAVRYDGPPQPLVPGQRWSTFQR